MKIFLTLVPPLELPNVSPLTIGTTYQTKVAFRELLNGNDTTEIYAIDSLSSPLFLSKKIKIEGLSNYAAENLAPVKFDSTKHWITKYVGKISLNQWDLCACRRFYVDFKVSFWALVKPV